MSSITIVLNLGIISSIRAPKRLVFPLDLVPATRRVLEPSIMKLNNPAAKELSILLFMYKGKVQGLSLWRRKA